MTLEKTFKFLIVFIRLILREKEVDRVTGPRREFGILNRHEFDLKVTL